MAIVAKHACNLRVPGDAVRVQDAGRSADGHAARGAVHVRGLGPGRATAGGRGRVVVAARVRRDAESRASELEHRRYFGRR